MVSWTWGRGAIHLSLPPHGLLHRVAYQLRRNLTVNGFWATAGYPTSALGVALASALADALEQRGRDPVSREEVADVLSQIWRCIASLALVDSQQDIREASLQLMGEVGVTNSLGAGFREVIPGLRLLSERLASKGPSCGVFCGVLSLSGVTWSDIDKHCMASIDSGTGDAFFVHRSQVDTGVRMQLKANVEAIRACGN